MGTHLKKSLPRISTFINLRLIKGIMFHHKEEQRKEMHVFFFIRFEFFLFVVPQLFNLINSIQRAVEGIRGWARLRGWVRHTLIVSIKGGGYNLQQPETPLAYTYRHYAGFCSVLSYKGLFVSNSHLLGVPNRTVGYAQYTPRLLVLTG
jgi:hypothetical protein